MAHGMGILQHEEDNFADSCDNDLPSLEKDISILDLLEHDDRPTLVVAGHPLDGKNTLSRKIVFKNAAFRIQEESEKSETVNGNHHDEHESSSIYKWMGALLDCKAQTVKWRNHSWTFFKVGRWQIIHGTPSCKTVEDNGAQDPLPTSHIEDSLMPRKTDDVPMAQSVQTDKYDLKVPLLDLSKFTKTNCSSDLSTYEQFIRDFDWSSSALGAPDTWSPQLKRNFITMLADQSPAALLWGPELILVYNEAFSKFLDSRHPGLFGKSPFQTYKEALPHFEPVFKYLLETGFAWRNAARDSRIFLIRNGYLEECYLKRIYIPVSGSEGEVIGFYDCVTETTQKVLAARRSQTLHDLSFHTSCASGLTDFWKRTITGLEENVYDIPVALIYSSSGLSNDGTGTLALENSLGIVDQNLDGLRRIDMKEESGLAEAFRRAVNTEVSQILDYDEGSFPKLIATQSPIRGHDSRCTRAVVCPLRPTHSNSVFAFIVFGLNPRRQFDTDYAQFIDLLNRQIATALASTVLYESELQKGRTALDEAALFQAQLTAMLDKRTQEANENEMKFTRFAQRSPIAISVVDQEGNFKFCNNQWYRITSIPDGVKVDFETWLGSIHPDDVSKVRDLFNAITINKKAITDEVRIKVPWNRSDLIHGEMHLDCTWVLLYMYPEIGDTGAIKYVLSYMTDISYQKWTLELQQHRMEEALETKRQQNEFIDMTSHEMRNPLNAITQCAESISTEIQSFETGTEVMANIYEAAQTIAHCAEHQYRIVNDILTLSKLDSDLLGVSPVEIEPVTHFCSLLKMFDRQVKTADIELHRNVDESLQKLNVDRLMFDPSRFHQVLLNLVTNAIKFTQGEERRRIVITLKVFETPPDTIDFLPRQKETDPTKASCWGDGSPIYLYLSVDDSGRGIAEEEKQNLFQRFAQASLRTHVNYGGSGLGLFICRHLVELQGGRIGFSSQVGKGSSFYFFIKTRRSVTNIAPGSEKSMVPDCVANTKLEDDEKSKECQPVKPQQMNLMCTSPSDPSTPLPPKLVKKQRKPLNRSTSNLSDFTILIVEDNLINQRLLRDQLKKLNANVLVANHGEEALTILLDSSFWSKTGHFHLVFMDIEMPIMDGLTCTKNIRRLQNEEKLPKRLPVIALTANARGEQKQNALDAGVDHVALKPYKLSEVVQLIESLKNLDI